jgi:hypothetical protein
MSVNDPVINDRIIINNQVTFITDNINELMIHDRRNILQILYNSNVRNKLKEKGGGTQIKIDELSDHIIIKLYDLICTKLNEQKIQLNFL